MRSSSIDHQPKEQQSKEQEIMKFMHLSKKKMAALGLAFGVALGAGGIAAAYLSSSGTGTGSATVGSAKGLEVTGGNVTTLLPGTTKTATFKVHNPNGFKVHFTGGTATVTESTATCLISKASGPAPTSGTIAATGTATVTVTVKMVTNISFNQTGCHATVHLHV
jgi:hypothetical protein